MIVVVLTALRFKCRYKYREKCISDICREQKYHLLSKNGEVVLKAVPSGTLWYTLVQSGADANVCFCKYNECHLVTYTQVPPYITIVKVKFNVKWWDEQNPKLSLLF